MEIPQSQTADNPVAPPGRAAQPSQDKLSKATSSLLPIKSFACLVTWCGLDNLQIKKRPIIFVMQSNIASKPFTLMPRYTTTENKQMTSLIAVEFVSLVYIQCKTNLEASEHAFL